MNRSEYDSIRTSLYTERRRLPMLSRRRYAAQADMAMEILRAIEPLPKLAPVWAYHVYSGAHLDDYEGTVQTIEEAQDYERQGMRTEPVPALFGGRGAVSQNLECLAIAAKKALDHVHQILSGQGVAR